MAATVYAIHAPDPAKLEAVRSEMERLGAPTIHVVDCGDHYMALEGSHRLAAAYALDLTPNLVVHDQGEIIEISGYDWYDEANWSETSYAAGEVAGELFSPRQATPYTFPRS